VTDVGLGQQSVGSYQRGAAAVASEPERLRLADLALAVRTGGAVAAGDGGGPVVAPAPGCQVELPQPRRCWALGTATSGPFSPESGQVIDRASSIGLPGSARPARFPASGSFDLPSATATGEPGARLTSLWPIQAVGCRIPAPLGMANSASDSAAALPGQGAAGSRAAFSASRRRAVRGSPQPPAVVATTKSPSGQPRRP